MKPLFPKTFLTFLFVSISALTYKSHAACGTATTPVMINFDWQYFDTLPTGTAGFRFMMGKTSMQLKWTGTNTLNGTTAAHTGSTGSFGAGNDLKFVKGNGADTLTFQDELDSVRLSFFDLDNRQVVTVRAQNNAGTYQNIFLSKVSGTIITITNNGTTTATATAGSGAAANTSTDGTLNIRVPSGVKKLIFTHTKSSGTDSIYMSDVTGYLCNNIANWATDYQSASTPEPGQPTYTLASYNNHIYVVDITNNTSSILYTDPSLTSINSLAYDPTRQIIYYTNNTRVHTNKTIYKYDVKTNTKSTFVADVTTIGFSLWAAANSGLGSAGACYYDGALYFATDANTTVGQATTIYRIDIDSATGTAIRASRFWSRNALPNISTRLFDWSDFVMKDGVSYCFNQSNPSPSNFGAFHVSLNLQDTIASFTTSVRVQMSMDYAENIYHMGSYGAIDSYNEAGGFTSMGSYTRVNAADTLITDGGESFKYPYDFGTDTASYGMPFTLYNPAQNLRLGSSINYSATSALDEATNDNDGVSTFPELTVANASYSIDVDLRNMTGSSAVLYGYIDFNGDGDFDDPGERSDPVTVVDGATSATVTWTGLTGGVVGPTMMRLRLAPTDAEARYPGGYASNGETEDFGITIGMSSLPVELIRFTGKKTETGTVQLDWSTASEFNNDYFEIQRSADFNQWTPIGQVKGHGNSNQQIAYSFEDKDPQNGNNYYRLKQVDFNKKSDFSPVINVKFDGETAVKENAFQQKEPVLYPNPAKDEFWIRSDEGDFRDNGMEAVEVYNLSGDMIYTAGLEGNIHQVDLREQPVGLYLVRMGNKAYKIFKN